MTMNKSVGNMYPFVSHTWNPIKGKCPHECVYCSIEDIAKRFNKPQQPLRLDKKCLKDDLGKNNFIFVGSSTDMFAEEVSNIWIYSVLKKCGENKNKYLFQTKNPEKMLEFLQAFPKDTVLGITLETNKDRSEFSSAPYSSMRVQHFSKNITNIEKMISIEPIMDFDLKPFVSMIKSIRPQFVSVGADSKNHGLPEPSMEKVKELVEELKKFTTVKIKDNLKRLK